MRNSNGHTYTPSFGTQQLIFVTFFGNCPTHNEEVQMNAKQQNLDFYTYASPSRCEICEKWKKKWLVNCAKNQGKVIKDQGFSFKKQWKICSL